MKCLYTGKCNFGKGNKDGKCIATLKFPQYCRYRISERSKLINPSK